MPQPQYSLDITGETCPLTYVRTKLALEEMKPGELLLVRLRAGEPLDNVPRTLREHGHDVVELTSEDGEIFRMLVRKG